MSSIWFDIGLIMIISCLLAVLARLLKQPMIPAYIFAGLLLGPIFGLVKNLELIRSLSEFGIAFLLFFAGLELNLKKLQGISKTAAVTGITQVVVVVALTVAVASAFAIKTPELIFLAFAIAFSSTAAIVKLLADRQELDTLHARLTIGILLVQDIVAILALTLLSTSEFHLVGMLLPLLKMLLLVVIALLLGLLLKPALHFAARSTELLFLTALAICFLFALTAAISVFGLPSLSVAVGAFIAGLMLANSPYKVEIESSVRSLRDFFVIIFFVSIGMQLLLAEIKGSAIWLALMLLLIVLFVEPYLTAFVIRAAGYTSRTAFLSGFLQAQTSEFSILLVAQGLVLGLVSQATFSLIVLITVLTMALTPFFVANQGALYSKMRWLFSFFPPRHEPGYTKGKKEILLVGCHRMGTIFLKAFKTLKQKLLVVDYNPEIIQSLAKQKISCIYGDMTSTELLARLPELKLAVSTIPDVEKNLLLTRHLKKLNPQTLVIVTADRIHDGLELYKAGVDYVIMPQLLGGETGLDMLKKISTANLEKIKTQHIAYLKQLHTFLYSRLKKRIKY